MFRSVCTYFYNRERLGVGVCLVCDSVVAAQVNVSNIGNIVQELFQENIVRGR